MERKSNSETLRTSDLAGVSRKPLLEPDRKPLTDGGVEPVAIEKQPERMPVATAGETDGPEKQARQAPIAETGAEHLAPLVDNAAAEHFRNRWNEIQVSFVDEPRHAVEKADELVAETIHQLAESFAKERTGLESQWDRGDQISTEDLRQALQKYRSFFHRLLAA